MPAKINYTLLIRRLLFQTKVETTVRKRILGELTEKQ